MDSGNTRFLTELNFRYLNGLMDSPARITLAKLQAALSQLKLEVMARPGEYEAEGLHCQYLALCLLLLDKSIRTREDELLVANNLLRQVRDGSARGLFSTTLVEFPQAHIERQVSFIHQLQAMRRVLMDYSLIHRHNNASMAAQERAIIDQERLENQQRTPGNRRSHVDLGAPLVIRAAPVVISSNSFSGMATWGDEAHARLQQIRLAIDQDGPTSASGSRLGSAHNLANNAAEAERRDRNCVHPERIFPQLSVPLPLPADFPPLVHILDIRQREQILVASQTNSQLTPSLPPRASAPTWFPPPSPATVSSQPRLPAPVPAPRPRHPTSLFRPPPPSNHTSTRHPVPLPLETPTPHRPSPVTATPILRDSLQRPPLTPRPQPTSSSALEVLSALSGISQHLTITTPSAAITHASVDNTSRTLHERWSTRPVSRDPGHHPPSSSSSLHHAPPSSRTHTALSASGGSCTVVPRPSSATVPAPPPVGEDLPPSYEEVIGHPTFPTPVPASGASFPPVLSLPEARAQDTVTDFTSPESLARSHVPTPSTSTGFTHDSHPERPTILHIHSPGSHLAQPNAQPRPLPPSSSPTSPPLDPALGTSTQPNSPTIDPGSFTPVPMDLETSPPLLPVILDHIPSPLPSPSGAAANARAECLTRVSPPSSPSPTHDRAARSQLMTRFAALDLFHIFFDDGCATSWRALFSPELSAQRRHLLATLPNLQLQFFALARHLHRQISLKLGSPSARRTKTIHITMDMIRLIRDLDFPVKFAVQKVLRMVVKTVTHTTFLMVYQRFRSTTTQRSPVSSEFRHLFALAAAGRSPPQVLNARDITSISPTYSGVTTSDPATMTPHEQQTIPIDFGSIPLDLTVDNSSSYSSPSPPPRRSRPSVSCTESQPRPPPCIVSLPKLRHAIDKAQAKVASRPSASTPPTSQAMSSLPGSPGSSQPLPPLLAPTSRSSESHRARNERLLEEIDEAHRRRSSPSSASPKLLPKKRSHK